MAMPILLRGLVAALVLAAAPALAQGPWQQKPVRIVVPFQAGGSNNTLCRIVGETLSASWGQPVIVDNRAGAGGNIGAETVLRAEPAPRLMSC